jgi:P27 family predicted phage terminase small subunit
MKGRKPVPTARKRLEGNPGKRALPRDEPDIPDTGDLDGVPPELAGDPVAVREWSRLAPLLRRVGVLTDADALTLVAVCQQWSRYLAADRRVRRDGMVVKVRGGFPRPNPYVQIANKALLMSVRLWTELGMTPSARTRVHRAPDTPPGDDFAEFDEPVEATAAGPRSTQ